MQNNEYFRSGDDKPFYLVITNSKWYFIANWQLFSAYDSIPAVHSKEFKNLNWTNKVSKLEKKFLNNVLKESIID